MKTRLLTVALIAATGLGLAACKNTDTKKLAAISAAPAGAVAVPAMAVGTTVDAVAAVK